MLFECSAKSPNMNMVIYPRMTHKEALDRGYDKVHKPMSVQFRDGRLDTEAFAKKEGWSDAEREEVEAKLQSYPGFVPAPIPSGTGRTFWIAKPLSVSAEPQQVSGTLCLHVDRYDDGTANSCTSFAVADSDYCDAHVTDALEVSV